MSLRDDSEYNVAIVVAGSATLIATALIAYVRIHWWWRRNRGSGLASLLRELTDVFGSALPLEPHGRKAQQHEELEKRRIVWARWLLPFGLISSMTHLASVVFRALVSFDQELSSTALATSLSSFAATSLSQDFSVFYVTLVIFVMWAMPSLVTLKTLDVWYSLLMVGMVWQAAPTGYRADILMEHAISMWIIAFGFSVFNLHLKANLFWLFALNASACATLLAGEAAPRSPPAVDKVVQLSIATAMWAFILHGIHYFVLQIVRLEMDATVSRQELAAARSVLRGVCDVVVELDECFAIKEGGAALADMLLIGHHRVNLQDIRTYMSTDQDREQFARHMESLAVPDPDGEGMCAAFHSNMKDSSGIPVRVEMFSVRFEDRHRQRAFFVGIREFADGYNPVGPTGGQRYGERRSQEVCSVSASNVSASPLRGASAAARHDDPSTLSSLSSGDEGTESVLSLPSATDAATAVWIDLLSEEYTVVGVSPGFQMTFGDDLGGLLQWVGSADIEDFVCWAQEARFTLESPQSEPAAYHSRVTILNPKLREQRLSASASVGMDLVDLPQDSTSRSAPTCICGQAMCTNLAEPEESGGRYVCDRCGGESGDGHLDHLRRWSCTRCSRSVCFTCHAAPKFVVRLVLLDIRWARKKGAGTRRKRAGRQRPPQAGPRRRPSEEQSATSFGTQLRL